MRTDCKISRRKVYCPKSSRLGFDKTYTEPGDIIVYEDGNDHCSTAIVLGRVSAPACGETPAIKGWILCVAILPDLGSAQERWVNPEWVKQVTAFPKRFLKFITEADFKADSLKIRELADKGSLSEFSIAYNAKDFA